MIESFTETLALVGIVVLVSSLLSGLIDRTGLPQVGIYLLLGAILGPAGLGLVDLGLRTPTLQVIATLALVLVLFSDAIGVDVSEMGRHRRLALLVLGPGTLLPAMAISLAAYCILGVSAPAALILGASLASTDPVLLRRLVRRPELPGVARLALRLESGMNDVVLLPIVMLSMVALSGEADMLRGHLPRQLLGLFVLGPVLGAAVGWVAITLLEQVRKRIGVRRDYESLYALGVAFTAFAAAEAVHGSGFLAAFAAGMVIAALDVELCDCFLDYGQASAEMFLLLTFVAFGASVIWVGATMADARTLVFAIIALAMRTAIMLPTLRAAVSDQRSRRLIAWFGPRGLSSLLLVMLPVFAGVPGSERLFATVALVVLLSVVFHGSAIALFLRAGDRASPEAAAAGATVASPAPVASVPAAAHALADQPAVPPAAALEVPERITIPEMRALIERREPVVIVDARTPRSYRDDPRHARGAVRMVPDEAVRTARQLGLDQHATLVVYCS